MNLVQWKTITYRQNGIDIIVIDDSTSIAKMLSFQDSRKPIIAIDIFITVKIADANVASDINKLRELFSDLADFMRNFLSSNNCYETLVRRSSILD